MKLHFVGIGGIGMSALAAMALDLGHRVSGSDRGADRPENARIIGALKFSGITIYPQDGSFMQYETPDCLVYSTAIEEDNPDFAAAKGLPRMHRSELLEKLLGELPPDTVSIAVTGSCGKSTATAYAAEALLNLGADPGCLDGALVTRFSSEGQAGNYRSGGKFFVFEADESDKSLLNYSADYAVILNLGTDHYSRSELVRVFGEFLRSIRKGAVLEQEVYREIAAEKMIPGHLDIRVFGDGDDCITDVLTGYEVVGRRPRATFGNGTTVALPQPGRHMALNALAVGALLELIGFDRAEIPAALERFDGVWRRNDFAGKTPEGAAVYDDYAHNPEKIRANLRLMRELAGGGAVYAVFQPHGYGPFGFMEQTLFRYLESELRDNDRFILLEPYYAGGTSSFSPHAEEVCAKWRQNAAYPERYLCLPDRAEVKRFLRAQAGEGDIIAVMGARDNSLSDFAREIAN